jgi:hypothetical protein
VANKMFVAPRKGSEGTCSLSDEIDEGMEWSTWMNRGVVHGGTARCSFAMPILCLLCFEAQQDFGLLAVKATSLQSSR